jgi:hypothetical protein
MELHIRASSGILIANVKGDTALELKDRLTQSLDFESSFMDYLPINKENLLVYKAVRNSPITIGDTTHMLWARDYVYVVI